MKFEDGPVPLGIAPRQIVVYRYDMYALSRKGVEVSRQCADQRFTLAGGHLCNFTLVEHNTANELYVVVHHVPGHLRACGIPPVFPNRLIAVDQHISLGGGDLSIKIRS